MTANMNHGDRIQRINELQEMINTAELLGQRNTERLQDLTWQLHELLDSDDETVASSIESPDDFLRGSSDLVPDWLVPSPTTYEPSIGDGGGALVS